MTRKQGFLCFLVAFIVAAVAVPITSEVVPITRNLETEAKIISDIEALAAARKSFNAAVVTILKETGQPAIQNANNIIQQGKTILAASNDYAASTGADPNQTAAVLGLIASKCDMKSLEENERMLNLMLIVIKMCAEEITHEPIDPNLLSL